MNIFLPLLFIFAIATLNAKVIYVKTDQQFLGGDGTSWSSPLKYLSDAIPLADEYGDEIWICGSMSGSWKIDNDSNTGCPSEYVKIYGGFAGSENTIFERNLSSNTTTIYSSSPFTVGDSVSYAYSNLQVQNRRVYIDGITFTGKGVLIAGDANLILNECTLSSNTAQGGSLGQTTFGVITVMNEAEFTAKSTNFLYNRPGTNKSLISAQSEPVVNLIGCVFDDNFGSQSERQNLFRYVEVTAINCVFTNNMLKSDSMIRSSGKFINCIFYNNSSNFGTTATNLLNPYNYSDFQLINCTFLNNQFTRLGGGNLIMVNNIFDDTMPITNYHQNYGYMKNSFEDGFSISNDKRSKNLFLSGINSLPGHFNVGSTEFIITDDPLFVNESNPKGVDGIWLTEDDGLRLAEGSPAISQGNSTILPQDILDIDNNNNSSEPIPLDIRGSARVVNGSIDLGAYQSSIKYSLILNFNSSQINVTKNPDKSVFEDGETVLVNAMPSPGYILGNSIWNNRQIIMDSEKSYTISSYLDLNDNDSDGLSNYDEIIVYLSNASLPDTSGDGLMDGEVVSLGFDPNLDYSNLLNLRPTQEDYDSVVSERDSRPTQEAYNQVIAERDARPTQASYDAIVAERDAKLTLEEVAELRPGTTMIEVSEDQATVQLQMEESSDLQTWQDTGTPATMTIPADTDTKFFRFKMAE